MVELQSVSITLAGLSFIVAATYYVMNIREQRRNRKITLTTTMLQHFMTDEGYFKIMDLLTLKWDSLEDYMNKYDSRVDPKNAARRMSLWNTCETLGLLYREGLLDLDIIFASSGGIIYTIWKKFEPIIESYRGGDYSRDAYSNFEYLAKKIGERAKMDELAPRHLT